MRTRTIVLAAVGVLAAGPSFAHHAWPVDRSKEVTVKGTVTAPLRQALACADAWLAS